MRMKNKNKIKQRKYGWYVLMLECHFFFQNVVRVSMVHAAAAATTNATATNAATTNAAAAADTAKHANSTNVMPAFSTATATAAPTTIYQLSPDTSAITSTTTATAVTTTTTEHADADADYTTIAAGTICTINAINAISTANGLQLQQ